MVYQTDDSALINCTLYFDVCYTFTCLYYPLASNVTYVGLAGNLIAGGGRIFFNAGSDIELAEDLEGYEFIGGNTYAVKVIEDALLNLVVNRTEVTFTVKPFGITPADSENLTKYQI